MFSRKIKNRSGSISVQIIRKDRGRYRVVRTGRLTKQSINNRGYNKFPVLKGEITVRIDPGKIEEDQQWDGLKGYLTNTQLSAGKVIENYAHLWQIERAFRISKTGFQ